MEEQTVAPATVVEPKVKKPVSEAKRKQLEGAREMDVQKKVIELVAKTNLNQRKKRRTINNKMSLSATENENIDMNLVKEYIKIATRIKSEAELNQSQPTPCRRIRTLPCFHNKDLTVTSCGREILGPRHITRTLDRELMS